MRKANLKFEILNPKQYQMIKIQKKASEMSRLRIWYFVIGICLEFAIWNLRFATSGVH
jgi:hypothetical protein